MSVKTCTLQSRWDDSLRRSLLLQCIYLNGAFLSNQLAKKVQTRRGGQLPERVDNGMSKKCKEEEEVDGWGSSCPHWGKGFKITGSTGAGSLSGSVKSDSSSPTASVKTHRMLGNSSKECNLLFWDELTLQDIHHLYEHQTQGLPSMSSEALSWGPMAW